MKKLLVLLSLIAVFALVSCGGEQTAKPTTDAKDAKVATATGDFAKALIGEWECEETGDVLPQYKMGKPSGFTFKDDGSYVYYMTLNGVTLTYTGKYIVDSTKKPVWIDFQQEKIKDPEGNFVEEYKGRKAKDVAHGIIALKDGKLQAIFYRKAFFPRPEEIGGSDTQVFKKK